MKKLTEEKCQDLIGALVYAQISGGISTKEELYLQALQIALESMGSGWIKCSDRMPEQKQSNRYVALNLLLNERTVAQGGFDDGEFWIESVVVNNVTHWKPLPTPPEAK